MYCLFLWSLAGPRPAVAASYLTFAVIDSAPFGARQQNNTLEGIYPALLTAISKKSGIEIRVVLVPFARAAHLVTSGDVDGTIMFKTTGTEGKTVPIVALFETGLIVQSGPGLKLTSKADLSQRLIGRIRGGCQDLETDNSRRWRFYELNTQLQGVSMLAAGRIDAFCTVPEAIAVALMTSGRSSKKN